MMARARIYLASEAARKQLEALEAHYAAEAAWRKAEGDRALQRLAGVRKVRAQWMARVSVAAGAMEVAA
jgi:hypothetical protein